MCFCVANTFSEPSVFVAFVCHVTVMWCPLNYSVMIKDHQDMFHVPMTCMVLEICEKIQKGDFLL